MSAPQLPLVSVAIPLFQSRRFFDGIIGNIVAIDYPHLEVIISDRHCADDTIELLAERFASDRRIRCLKGSDRLNWVEHFNLLLRIASGRYFMWMAHDDYYPSDYVSQLVSCLENRPDVVLAYGRLEAVHLDDRPIGWSAVQRYQDGVIHDVISGAQRLNRPDSAAAFTASLKPCPDTIIRR